MLPRIYLDHAATTPLSPVAHEAMVPWLNSGNASSLHAEGRKARAAMDESRERLSEAMNCRFGEVIFTSGGTEAANLAIIGSALSNKDASRNRILLGSAEHHCVLHTKGILERLGYVVQTVPVDCEARVRFDAYQEMLGEDVLLVSIMHANNELGSVNPSQEIVRLGKAAGALVHVDAVQTFLTLALPEDADMVSVSAHKINGPKGVGALRVRSGVKPQPIVVGGGQERELRAGTENVAGIVGFSAVVANGNKQDNRLEATSVFRDLLSDIGVPSLKSGERLPGHVHMRFPGVDAEMLLIRLDRAGISASGGSACSSGSAEPSHVLSACGYSLKEAKEGVRFSFGKETTTDEAREAARRVRECVTLIRETAAK